jgi:carbon storage regulator CsrA
MLVLSRKLQQQLQIGENVTITVLRVRGNVVRLGIEAPKNVRVVRAELKPLEVELDGNGAPKSAAEPASSDETTAAD